MAKFICRQVERYKDERSLEEAQELYRKFFINTHIYESYKSDTDKMLISDGYSDCIVTE